MPSLDGSAAGQLAAVAAPAVDRVAWLADASAHDSSTDDAPRTAGAWTQKLAAHHAVPSAAWTRALAAVHEQVRAERARVADEVAARMSRAEHVVTEAVRHAHAVVADADDVRASLSALRDARARVGGPAASSALVHVQRWAQAKMRLQETRELLQAIESWPLVEADVRASLQDGEWERAAGRLADMRASLALLADESEHGDAQRRTHAALVARVLEAATPPLRRAIDAQDAARVAELARVWSLCDAAPQLATLYLDARTAHIGAAWHDMAHAARAAHRAPDVVASVAQQLCELLTALLDDEVALWAPALLGGAGGAASVLSHAWASLAPPWSTLLAEVDDLAAIEAAVQYVHAAAAHWDAQCAGAGAGTGAHAPADAHEPLVRLPPCDDWRQHAALPWMDDEYEARERAYLAAAWDASKAAWDAQLNRVWVATLSVEGASWAPGVVQVCEALQGQVLAAQRLQQGALTRMYTLTGGRGAAGLEGALRHALYPAVVQRVATALESLRTRYRQSLPAAGAADAVPDDMDAMHDWGLIRAGALSLGVAQALAALPDALDTAARAAPSGAGGPAPLRLAVDAAPATHAAQRLVADLILTPFRQLLQVYRHEGAAGGGGGGAATWAPVEQVKVPTFSRSPSESIVRLGEGLLNLPRLLEAVVEREWALMSYDADALLYAHDEARGTSARKAARAVSYEVLAPGSDDAGAARMAAAGGGAAALDQVLALWLRSLTRTLLTSLEQEALPAIVARRGWDQAQLAADMDYMSTIASALNAASDTLRAWAAVLSMEAPEAAGLPADHPLRASAAYAAITSAPRGAP